MVKENIDKDLWLGISGKAKAKVTMKYAYYEYKDRFHLEHYFKFSKSKLLTDKFQSSDPKKDEDFMLFETISYIMQQRRYT